MHSRAAIHLRTDPSTHTHAPLHTHTHTHTHTHHYTHTHTHHYTHTTTPYTHHNTTPHHTIHSNTHKHTHTHTHTHTLSQPKPSRQMGGVCEHTGQWESSIYHTAIDLWLGVWHDCMWQHYRYYRRECSREGRACFLMSPTQKCAGFALAGNFWNFVPVKISVCWKQNQQSVRCTGCYFVLPVLKNINTAEIGRESACGTRVCVWVCESVCVCDRVCSGVCVWLCV